MKDFLTEVVREMDVEMGTAQSAAGALLKAARDNLSHEDYATLSDSIDGADELIAQSPQETKPEEGIKEAAQGVLGRAAEALGAEKSGSLGVGTLLGAAGMAPDQMPRFVEMFLEYVRENAGSDVAGSMVSKMSGLLDLKSGDISI